MNKPYPASVEYSTGTTVAESSQPRPLIRQQTRFDAAKEALLGLVTDLMLESKLNLCGVIVLHTMESSHHLLQGEEEKEEQKNQQDKYRHITELSPVERPTVDLLRQINKLSCLGGCDTDKHDERGTTATVPTSHHHGKHFGNVPPRQGGFCDGIIVAASAMYLKTFGKRFSRKIVLLTDAERQVDIHWDELDDVVAGLRQMGCSLTVIGLDFKSSAEFEEPAVIDNHDECDDDDDDAKKQGDADNGDIGPENCDVGTFDGSVSDMDVEMEKQLMASKDEGLSTASVKDENEKFLTSLTKYTGGKVYSTCTIQQMLKQARGRRIPKSTLSKIDFQIAPGVSVDARVSLYTSQQSFPTLKREAISIGSDGQIQKNALGEIMSIPVTNVTSHWDADEPDIEVDLEHRALGFPYGSDLIPLGTMELEGLKMRSDPRITILGYASMECIPMSVWMGPMRIVSGDKDSTRACLAVSAIAQALMKLNQVAICTFVKQKDSDPDMGILLPLVEEETTQPRHLLYVRIPYADDIQNLTMHPLCDAVDDEAVSVCDDLIDAFMLPQNTFNPALIPNPAIRNFRKTMIRRAIHSAEKTELEEVKNSSRVADDEDQFRNADALLENRKKNALLRFHATFPLEVTPKVTNDQKQKKRYFLSDSQY
jgi:Ku70/Ku80 beta-barrel domain.